MRLKLGLAVFSCCLLSVGTGCSGFNKFDGLKVLVSEKREKELNKVAVIPLFEVHQEEGGRVAVCPVTHVTAEPAGKVPDGSGEVLARSLLKGIKRSGTSIVFTSLEESFQLYRNIQGEKSFSYDIDAASTVGKKLGVDAVFLGSVLRFSEREGSSWAVGRPASLAFTFVLVDVDTKEVLWTARYDKVQKPLSDNILNIKSFWKLGMRWITVTRLAENAAEALAAEFTRFLMKKN
ncbi:MAG: hypothetical protein ACE5FU_01095 [Nitrospinota bacterium]